MDQYIGKMLDNRYEILENIGNGGMAVVYKARCHRLNRLVAVKILKPELASDADFRRRFHDESQAVAMLSHSNIVSVYDVSNSDGLDYIVMELIDGLTLKQYMKKRGAPLNWREALHFITQIIRALEHAHSRGIIHRDIKPHNILVLRDGSVKVTDFGIAQLASSAQSTMTLETLGSVHYISPEQAKGSHVDCRTDLYSAGVVLYEMLTGRLPFEGDTPVFVAIQHINSIPIRPRELNPDIPPALENIILKAMAPELGQRYTSAMEMLEDLKEFRKNPGAVVEHPSSSYSSGDEEPTQVVPVAQIMAGNGKRDGSERAQRQGYKEARGHRRGDMPKDDHDDVPVKEGWNRRSTITAVLVILLFVAGLGFFIYNFLIRGILSNDVKQYEVPNVLGYTLDELRENPDLLDGFELEEGAPMFSPDYGEGEICSQTPEAGDMVREGKRTITVNVSSGEDKLYMIDVKGWEGRRALRELQDEMGLDVEQKEEYDDTVTAGYVISYSPMEGTSLKKGDRVTIVISKGREAPLVTVPSFLNQDIDTVRTQIKRLGLKIGKIDEYYSDEYDEGRVSWQSIPSTTQVEEGITIDLWVSRGPKEEPTPTPAPSESSGPVHNEGSSTQTVTADLSQHTGTVSVRIMVGSTTLYDGAVDAATGSLSRSITASGQQTVSIYINNELVRSYDLQF